VNLLEHGASWLADQRRAFMSQTVTYQRGSDSVDVPASIGQTVFRLTDDYGASTRTVSTDFLISADDLMLNGSPIEPQRGDRIRATLSGITYVQEVMAPSSSEPLWRYSDASRATYRIHTKQIDQEPAP
jgi:hypothetical protein